MGALSNLFKKRGLLAGGAAAVIALIANRKRKKSHGSADWDQPPAPPAEPTDEVDEWGVESFPASDPPQAW